MPVVEPLLDEFSIICPSLIEGMNGAQRRVVVRPLWDEPDPYRRSGAQADTFMEFQERVRRFIDERLDELPDGTVIFGHGIWCGDAAVAVGGKPGRGRGWGAGVPALSAGISDGEQRRG